MITAAESALDATVAQHCEAGDYRAAATAILSALGASVLRVIHARFRDEQLTGEVFSAFAESLWRALPRFQFRCSVRAWVFTLARNAGSRYLEREVKKQRAQLPLSEVPELAASLQSMRTRTLAHLRTENRERVAQIKAQLSEADQLLLTLRIDRELSFREIALVMLEDIDAEDAAVAREVARLRKRFQLVKDKLRRLLAT